MRCEIRVRGYLDGTWSAWFDGLTVTNGERGESVLAGDLPDQAALHGVLHKVRDLAIPLLAVTCTGPDLRDDSSVVATGEMEEP
jgi:hypothetical protein